MRKIRPRRSLAEWDDRVRRFRESGLAIAKFAAQEGIFIAEGVETVAERDMLEGLGCDLLQGYLFAMPQRGFPIPQW